MTKGVDGGERDVTFGHTQSDARFSGEGEDCVDVSQVSIEIRGVNDDVVNIDKSNLPLIVTKNLIHKTLENSRTILEAERHELPLVEPTVGSESGLGFGVFGERDLVETLVGIEGGEPFHSIEL